MIYPFFQKVNKSRDFSFEGNAGIKCSYIDKELDIKKLFKKLLIVQHQTQLKKSQKNLET